MRKINLATLLCLVAGLGVDGGVYIMVASLSVESLGSGALSSFGLGEDISCLGTLGLIMLAFIFLFLSFINC